MALLVLCAGLCGAQMTLAQSRVLRIDMPNSQKLLPPDESQGSWQEAVDHLILVSHKVEQIPNVSYKFEACFLKDGQCEAYSQAYRDDFRKVTYYHAPSKHSVAQNHVSFYLALEDNSTPKLIMRYSYVGNEWLFIKDVAVWVDGDVVFEHALLPTQIQRDALSGTMLYEVGDVLMNANQNVVELISNADLVAIKMTGKNGEAYLDGAMLSNMKIQAREILMMFDLLQNAIEHTPADMTI